MRLCRRLHPTHRITHQNGKEQLERKISNKDGSWKAKRLITNTFTQRSTQQIAQLKSRKTRNIKKKIKTKIAANQLITAIAGKTGFELACKYSIINQLQIQKYPTHGTAHG